MARSKLTLSNYKLLSGDIGNLYPIGLTEILPNDGVQHSTNIFLRFSPMAAPIMHPISVRVVHMFAPMRILWPTEKQTGQNDTGWESFITGGKDGDDGQLIPQMSSTVTKGSLLDYLGLPVSASTLSFSALPIRMYNMCYNEWFRDQDLIDERALTDTTIAKIAWEKDHFGIARPWPQKGPAITLPLGAKAPITGLGHTATAVSYTPQSTARRETGGDSNWINEANTGAQALYYAEDPDNAGYPGIFADLASASGVDITTWREAFALQRFAEARARYGSRYTEYLKYLGANPQDFRLQRPELLASGRAQVRVSEVLQTANETTPGRFGVGDLYGHGYASLRSNRYRKHFNEHGYLMTFLSVRPKTMYMNGMDRTWLKQTREEFFQKELQHIGQQEVWNGEILADGSTDRGTWGWSDRYEEYRNQRSTVAGDFRDTLKYWHMARDFGTTRPGLNANFVECDATKRMFNVQSEDGLWIAAQHQLVARRMVSQRSTPRVL